jgi:hypothetical protein
MNIIMRNSINYEDLAPSCMKISNNSADFYLSVRAKFSKSNFKRFIPSLNGVVSDENFISQRTEPLAIRGFELPSFTKKPFKSQPPILPKIEDSIAYKLYPKPKPIQNKPSHKRSPSKKVLVKMTERKETLAEKCTQRQISPLSAKIITKVSYKDAARLADWAIIAKPELEKIWRNLICMSNGVRMTGGAGFKYFVGKGNNAALIRKLMGNRSWWTATETMEEAHFVWTQWKDKEFIAGLPKAIGIEHCADGFNFPIISYQVPVRINNMYRQVDLTDLGFYKIKASNSYTVLSTMEISANHCKMYNKLEFNQHLSNKKGLFLCLKRYYEAIGKNVFECHPVTFHIIDGEEDPIFTNFLDAFNRYEKMKKKKKSKNIWNSNRGNGIQVCKNLAEIKQIIKEKVDVKLNQPRTYILQKYLEKPLLLDNRKFDIRCYALITCINGVLQGYFYSDGYIRTSCVEFSLNDTTNNFIHLTNDAVQKHSEDYGKYEDNNKMSYKDLQRYLDFQYPDENINFFATILPKIKNIVKDTIHAAYANLDSNKRMHCMEIFGYDFMIDSKLKPWIIEVNTNPCLELSSSYLSYLIPTMLENAFRITIDTMFHAPIFNKSHEPIPENRFELIFHQMVDGRKNLEEVGQVVDISDNEEVFMDSENPIGSDGHCFLSSAQEN